jgi:hypothetical protein
MAHVYYPYPTPNFNRNFYQSTPYPPWMAQPAYSYSGLSEMYNSQRWMTQPAMNDGGLSEFYYGQKWIRTAPMISPTYCPAPMLNQYPLMMSQPAMSYGGLSAMGSMPMMSPYMSTSPCFSPTASLMNYSQPQWFQPAPMFRYY